MAPSSALDIKPRGRYAFNLKKPITRIIYALYCMIGGIFTTKYISKWYKIFFILFNCLAFALVLSSVIHYNLTTSTKNVYEFVRLLLTPFGNLWKFFMFFFTVRHRHDVEIVVNRLDNNFGYSDANIDPKAARKREIKAISQIRWMTSLLLIFISVYWSFPPIHGLLFRHPSTFIRNVLYHQFPVLYLFRRLSTSGQYVWLYAFEMMILLPELIVYASHSLLIVAIGNEFHYQFALLRDEIKSCDTFIKMKDWRRFDDHLRICWFRYRELVAESKRLRTYIEIFSTLLLMCCCNGTIPTGYLTLTVHGVDDVNISSGMAFFILTFNFFLGCYAGTLFEEMNTMISNSIYCLRWFVMPPKRRTNVWLFLQLTSVRPIRFYALKIYPISMITFVRVMRFVYSAIQLLRILLQ